MANAVLVREYGEPPVSMAEILRYAGAGGGAPEQTIRLAEECLDAARGQLSYKVCWRELPVVRDAGRLDLGFARVDSHSLARNLDGCDAIVLFAATVGIGIDRLIARSEAASPARALMLQAVGAERIEALCDAFCRDISAREAARGRAARPRFSPGYGDLPIELQRDVFRVLECARWIGLTLNESLMMSPTKSVTAIVGLGCGAAREPAGCRACGKSDCLYRKERGHENH